MALNNPLIDEYSLKGAKGLLINITGGEDLTLFEVDQSVNKIRGEVESEGEVIFGAIQDEKMKGKIRVSIVATSLDGHKPESKTVLNMVTRIQNRNPGYSDNLFSNRNIEKNVINSIEGATALKLDSELEIKSNENNEGHAEIDDNSNSKGISIENASYIENNLELDDSLEKEKITEEETPKLFSEEDNLIETDLSVEGQDDTNNNEKLFEPNLTDDEEFEIPAFLRKQKY